MNKFNIKGNLIINNTQPISGITNDLNYINDPNSLSTNNSSKLYIDDYMDYTKNSISDQIIYADDITLSGSSNITFDKSDLKLKGYIKSNNGIVIYNSAMCVKLINKTGAPTIKGLVAQPINKNGFNSNINSIDIQPDGKILVGGYFNNYNGILTKGIARLNIDGSIDTLFNYGEGFNSEVYNVDIQSDNKIIVGGSFTEYNGVITNRIVKLNANSTIDTTFNSGGTGFNNYVNSINVQLDDKILVGGYFTEYNNSAFYNGRDVNRIVKLNSVDGEVSEIFNSGGTGFSSTGSIFCAKELSNNKILIGGQFNTYNGTQSIGIVRLNSDGTKDNTLIDGEMASIEGNIDVRTIDVQSNDKIIMGGGFIDYSGTTSRYLIRINSDGTIDNGFGTLFNIGPIMSTRVQPLDQKIIVAGWFSSFDSVSYGRIIRLNTDCTIDTTFNSGETGANNWINSAELQQDGKIVIGGYFTSYNGNSVNRLTRINSNGDFDTGFTIGTGFNNTVRCIHIESDGKILVGGDFTSYNGTTMNRIIRLNSDGTIDSGFIIGTGFNGTARSIDTQSDGKILVGGSFTEYNGQDNIRTIRLNSDGSIDYTFYEKQHCIYPDGEVSDVVLSLSNDDVLSLGDFTSYGFSYSKCFIKLNENGTIDQNFNTEYSFDNKINDFDIDSYNNIICVGNFTEFNKKSTKYIVKLNSNGTINQNFNTDTTFNSYYYPYCVSIQSDDKILVGGSFLSYSGVTANRIIRLNSGGTIDTSFNTGTGFNNNTNCFEIQSDGKILVGGDFTSYSGVTANRIIRLNVDGSIDTSFNTGDGFNNTVNYIKVQSNGKILVGGSFTEYNDYYKYYFIILNSNGEIDLNFNKPENGFTYYDEKNTKDNPIGIIMEDNVNDGEYTYIAIKGVCDVKLSTTSDPTEIGNSLAPGLGNDNGYIYNSNYGNIIARSLQSGNPGDTIKCLLFKQI